MEVTECYSLSRLCQVFVSLLSANNKKEAKLRCCQAILQAIEAGELATGQVS